MCFILKIFTEVLLNSIFTSTISGSKTHRSSFPSNFFRRLRTASFKMTWTINYYIVVPKHCFKRLQESEDYQNPTSFYKIK
jgi:hypothetical protein